MFYAESAEQIAFIQFCRYAGFPYNMIFAIENEGKTSPQKGYRAKLMGKLAGVCDLFLPYPSGEYHGLFIEMKAPKGRLSEAQKAFIKNVQKLHFAVCVCYSAEQAVNSVKNYVSGLKFGGDNCA